MLGHFENLAQVVAAGFDSSSAPAMFMNKNHEQGGLLIMNNDDLRQIDSVLKSKQLSQLQKCQARGLKIKNMDSHAGRPEDRHPVTIIFIARASNLSLR